ncbi:hypothetical protein ADK91_14145, partial [Streptomyces sp. XY511]
MYQLGEGEAPAAGGRAGGKTSFSVPRGAPTGPPPPPRPAPSQHAPTEPSLSIIARKLATTGSVLALAA